MTSVGIIITCVLSIVGAGSGWLILAVFGHEAAGALIQWGGPLVGLGSLVLQRINAAFCASSEIVGFDALTRETYADGIRKIRTAALRRTIFACALGVVAFVCGVLLGESTTIGDTVRLWLASIGGAVLLPAGFVMFLTLSLTTRPSEFVTSLREGAERERKHQEGLSRYSSSD